MANYFAEIDNSNVVIRVVVVETLVIAESLFGGIWKQTFMDDPTKNYAGIGYTYRADKDNFSPPAPYPSWIMNELCRWDAPVPYPGGLVPYKWNEDTLNWIEITTTA